jgi:hypothetical protein
MIAYALGQLAGILQVIAFVVALRLLTVAACRFHAAGMARVKR